MNARAKKWLKWFGIVVAVLVVLVVCVAFWLLGTETGARFALERAKSALAGKLLVAQAKGTLVSPLELQDVEYRDETSGVDVKVKSIRVEYELFGILSHTLHVKNAQIDGVDVALTTMPTPSGPTAPKPSLQSLLTPPLDVLLDSLHLGATHIAQDGKPVFALDTLDAAATWTSKALRVSKLALRAPDGRVDLVAAIDSYAELRGTGKVDVNWLVADESDKNRRAVATISMDGDGKQTRFVLALTAPVVANAHGTLAPTDKTLPWTIDFDVPAFDPNTLSKGASLKSLAVALKGSGDKNGGTLTGTVDADKHRVLLDPLKFASDEKIFTIETLHLRSPEASGSLTAHAKVQLDAKPIGGSAAIDWADVQLPADLVGQPLATHGHLDANGNADKFAAQGTMSLGPPKQLADIAFKLSGTPAKIALEQLDIKEPQTAKSHGTLQANGNIVLKPKLGWDIKAKADGLDPGVFAKDWPGAINFALASNGTMEKDGAAGKLKLERLDGTLRQRKLSGDADVSVRDIPVDPVKGNDFALSIGYQLLAKTLADKR